jgi:hypothetical protein
MMCRQDSEDYHEFRDEVLSGLSDGSAASFYGRVAIITDQSDYISVITMGDELTNHERAIVDRARAVNERRRTSNARR